MTLTLSLNEFQPLNCQRRDFREDFLEDHNLFVIYDYNLALKKLILVNSSFLVNGY